MIHSSDEALLHAATRGDIDRLRQAVLDGADILAKDKWVSECYDLKGLKGVALMMARVSQ